MQGYVLILEKMWTDLDALSVYLEESYDYVMSLKPKYIAWKILTFNTLSKRWNPDHFCFSFSYTDT
jgi:hypothetical protein